MMADDEAPVCGDAARYVEKQRLHVVLRLMNYRIEGVMHIDAKHRPLDMLNNPDPFLPITDARVYTGTTGALMAETDFLAINKEQIVLLREDKSGKAQPEEIGDDELPPGPLEEPEDGELGSLRVS